MWTQHHPGCRVAQFKTIRVAVPLNPTHVLFSLEGCAKEHSGGEDSEHPGSIHGASSVHVAGRLHVCRAIEEKFLARPGIAHGVEHGGERRGENIGVIDLTQLRSDGIGKLLRAG